MKQLKLKIAALVLAVFMAGTVLPVTALAVTNTDNAVEQVQTEAFWPNFRADRNNNGAVTAKIPGNANAATLYWATKCGTGWSDAPSSPIIVGDWLIVCSGITIRRMNRFTGELDSVTGTMVGSLAYSIIPPAYANGMIFVGLSDGRVQAFDADTLESLWVYQDSLKGQPNCPLTVHDGYLYTGFWNGEEKPANFVCLSVTDEDTENTTETKKAVWTHEVTGGYYWAGAYVCDDFLLVGTDDGKSSTSQTSSLLSLNPKTGAVIDQVSNLNGDIRSSVTYDTQSMRYYFTSKGGSFYSVAANAEGKLSDLKEIKLNGMSTSTPVVYNGRAYVGVAGSSQFSAYSGHNITVIDLASQKIAYTARTKGYPQTSGLLTTAYEDSDGYVYVYFIENYTPGAVRVIKDKPGVNAVVDPATVTVKVQGKDTTYNDCAPVLFTPSEKQAQYAICSPICDEYGTMYFKNDSGYMMALGTKVTEIKVENQPEKTVYTEGEALDTTGLRVTAYFANELFRDVTDEVTFSENAKKLSLADTGVTVYFNTVLYGDTLDTENGNQVNQKVLPLEADIDLTVVTAEQAKTLANVTDLIDAIGEVTLAAGEKITAARNAFDALDLDMQELVSNYALLEQAEQLFAELKQQIQQTQDKIAAIGEVTLASEEAIAQARAAYDALTEEQQAQVKNVAELTEAERKLAELKAQQVRSKDVVLEGANAIWSAGSNTDLRFRFDVPYAEFTGIYVDGQLLEEQYYEKSEGSVIIVLKQSYLQTLSQGTHTITLAAVSGEFSAEFTVAEQLNSPQTGDSGTLYIAWLVPAAGLILLMFGFRKRR